MKGIKAFKYIKKNRYKTGGVDGSLTTYWKVDDIKEVDGDIELCGNGFHFYTSNNFVFGINLFKEKTCFCEVEAIGDVKTDAEKCVTNKIKILRYIPKKEWQSKIKTRNNSGNYNLGYFNSGNYNSGNYNSGDRNSGYYNSGDRNSGNYNSGNYNSGDYNSGYRNSGDYNSGNYNSGDRNSGNYNSGNGYVNYFCKKTKYFLFDIEVNTIPSEITKIDMSWFNLNKKNYKEAWQECPNHILEKLKTIDIILKNKDKFYDITGLKL